MIAPRRRTCRDEARLLFVEDLVPVRRATVRNLKTSAAYEVEEAGDGQEGARHHGREAGRVDIIISDVSMPIMTGPEMLRKPIRR